MDQCMSMHNMKVVTCIDEVKENVHLTPGLAEHFIIL